MTILAAELDLPSEVDWSIDVRHSLHSEPLILVGPHHVCATASIGKLLLLVAIATAIETGHLSPETILERDDAIAVADSGLWQHLHSANIPLSDLCVLVGATSDNWATNALIEIVGLPEVAETGRLLGMRQTRLLDIVRDERTPDDPPALSVGSAAELRHLCESIRTGNNVSPKVAQQVRAWLALNTDLSMVAGAFGFDPLAHGEADRGYALWNKTGTNHGVRGDVGVVQRGAASATYAVLANWTPVGSDDPLRDDVLRTMRTIGDQIRHSLASA